MRTRMLAPLFLLEASAPLLVPTSPPFRFMTSYCFHTPWRFWEAIDATKYAFFLSLGALK